MVLMYNQQNSALKVASTFPADGNVRANQIAPFLGIALSTFWLYVKKGRIIQPRRHSKRLSVWDASYIRYLAENGIPEAPIKKDDEFCEIESC